MWKEIKDFENYEVSSDGQIKSLSRMVYYGTAYWKKPERLLKHYKCTNGYCGISLCKDGIIVKHLIHRLVAQAFIPNPENKDEVNHKDGNKENNCDWNLEWMTHLENMQHGYKTGLINHKGENNPMSKLYEKKV